MIKDVVFCLYYWAWSRGMYPKTNHITPKYNNMENILSTSIYKLQLVYSFMVANPWHEIFIEIDMKANYKIMHIESWFGRIIWWSQIIWLDDDTCILYGLLKSGYGPIMIEIDFFLFVLSHEYIFDM